MRKVEKVKEDKKTWKENGLSNVKDLYTEVSKEKYEKLDNVHHIKVHINI